MTVSSAMMWLAALLLIAMLIKPVTEKWHMPFAAVLIALGFVGSEIVVMAGFDTGIRYHSFHDLIFYIFLPLLIFQAAFTIDIEQLKTYWLPIVLFALPLMLLATFISALLIFWGIAHPVGFPFIAALLTGVLLSATDPAAVVGMMRELGAPKRLCILLEGESLLNDAMAIVTFSVLLQLALMPEAMLSVSDALSRFLIVLFGGLIVGVVVGLIAAFLLRFFQDNVSQAVVTLVAAYLGFLVAEKVLHVSGVVAVLVAGLILSHQLSTDRLKQDTSLFVDDFWQFNVFVAEALMFLFMGVTITVGMFTDNWLAMLIAIVAVLIARSVMLFTGAALLSPFKSQPRLPLSEQRLLLTGGLRGAVTLALVLSLPTELSYWWTIQSMAFGVVLFTFFVQAPLMPYLLRQAGQDNSH